MGCHDNSVCSHLEQHCPVRFHSEEILRDFCELQEHSTSWCEKTPKRPHPNELLFVCTTFRSQEPSNGDHPLLAQNTIFNKGKRCSFAKFCVLHGKYTQSHWHQRRSQRDSPLILSKIPKALFGQIFLKHSFCGQIGGGDRKLEHFSPPRHHWVNFLD